MITVIKLNVITDDHGLPEELRAKVEEALQDLMRDDPEGPLHALVSLEWKQTVMPRSYMESLPQRPADRIRAVAKPAPAARVPKPAAKARKRAQA